METYNEMLVLEQIRQGDSSAFKALVHEWQDNIHRFAYRFFYDEDDASEITQKTFIKVYHNLDQLEDPGKFGSWIYKIANNLCLDELKRAGRRKSSSLELVHHNGNEHTTPATHLEEKELGEWIQKALVTLPEEQRTVIILKEYEGFTFREISEILEISENTVKSRMYYGLTKMREYLNKWNINTKYLNNE